MDENPYKSPESPRTPLGHHMSLFQYLVHFIGVTMFVVILVITVSLVLVWIGDALYDIDMERAADR